MKKLCALCLILTASAVLCACGASKTKSEGEIITDIPSDFLVVDNYCHDTEYLNYDSIEILDRSTEGDVDNVYFWLYASNANYELKVHCRFTYCYSGSEWILNRAEVNDEDYSVMPVKGMDDSFPVKALHSDGIDNFTLCESNFDNNGEERYCTFSYEYRTSFPLYEQTVKRDFYYLFKSVLDTNDHGATIKMRWSCESDNSIIINENWEIYRTWTYVNRNSLVGDTTYTITLNYVDDTNVEYEARYVDENLDGECPTIRSGSGTVAVEIEYDNQGNPTMELELPMIYEQIEPFDIALGGGQVKHVEAGSEAPSFSLKFTVNQATLRISSYHWVGLSN